MYTAIKSHQILQPLNAIERASTSSGAHLTRNGSRRGQNDRVSNLKRGSMRGIQSLFNTHGGQYGGGSYDGRSSPAPSFAHSAHEVGVNVSFFFSQTFNSFKGMATNFISRALPIRVVSSCRPPWVLLQIYPTPSFARLKKMMTIV